MDAKLVLLAGAVVALATLTAGCIFVDEDEPREVRTGDGEEERDIDIGVRDGNDTRGNVSGDADARGNFTAA